MTKAAKYKREIAEERNAWAAQFDSCFICGKRADWLELQTHEIMSKAKLRNTWGLDCNYMRLCQLCHDQRIPFMGLAEQLAVKLLKDPRAYCVEALRELQSQVTGRETALVYDWEIIEAIRAMAIQGRLYG